MEFGYGPGPFNYYENPFSTDPRSYGLFQTFSPSDRAHYGGRHYGTGTEEKPWIEQDWIKEEQERTGDRFYMGLFSPSWRCEERQPFKINRFRPTWKRKRPGKLKKRYIDGDSTIRPQLEG